ncbi:hypothetical protein NPIL_351651 [Nephila pilipes]|uniref:BTB domain-containing protein n=1 Tax=Nephila pilipes TaxID=299642 RepID=A0A8X6QTE5_NEPPI|nr:hypothetical protein NPIL_351651 [Nephila pilipes]
MACYLQRLQNKSGPNSIAIHYDLSFVVEDSVLQPSVTLEDIFEKGQNKGKSEFLKRENVFDSNLLSKDNLTVICRIWEIKRRNKWRKIGRETETKEKNERISLFARTILKAEKRYLVWIIEKFSSFQLSERNTLVVLSSSDEKLMTLEFFLTEDCCDELITICVSYCNPSIKHFRFHSYLLDDTIGNKIEFGYQKCFNELKEGSKFLLFPAKAKLIEEKHTYFPNDMLSLHCEFAFSMGIAFEGIEMIENGIAPSIARSRVVEIKQTDFSSKLKNDLKSMYDQKLFCDVKLRTKTGYFQAHRNILSARSPVFKRMFPPMKAKNKEWIVSTDLDTDTMHRMLLYLYTDSLEDLKWKDAFQ